MTGGDCHFGRRSATAHKVVQVMLLVRAQYGIQRSLHLGIIRLDSNRKRVAASVRKGNSAGAAVSRIGFAADQPGALDAVNELAGSTHGEAQHLGQIANPKAAIA
jgi:hypothetical protein